MHTPPCVHVSLRKTTSLPTYLALAKPEIAPDSRGRDINYGGSIEHVVKVLFVCKLAKSPLRLGSRADLKVYFLIT